MTTPKMDLGAVSGMLASADFGRLGEYFTNLARTQPPTTTPAAPQSNQQSLASRSAIPLSPQMPSSMPSVLAPAASESPLRGYPYGIQKLHTPPPFPLHGFPTQPVVSGLAYTAPTPACIVCAASGQSTPHTHQHHQHQHHQHNKNSAIGAGAPNFAPQHQHGRAYQHRSVPVSHHGGPHNYIPPRNVPPPNTVDVPFGRSSVRKPGECRVYVGNLPIQTAQCELAALFAPFGELLEVFVLRRANPHTGGRGAFVRFARVADATAAVQGLDGFEWRSRRITVRLAPAGTSANDMIPAAGAFMALLSMFSQAGDVSNFAKGSPIEMMQKLAPMIQHFAEFTGGQSAPNHPPHALHAHPASLTPQLASQLGDMIRVGEGEQQQMVPAALIVQHVQQMLKAFSIPSTASSASPGSTPEPSPLPTRTPSPSQSSQSIRTPNTAAESPVAAVEQKAGQMDLAQVNSLLPLLVNFLTSQTPAEHHAPATA